MIAEVLSKTFLLSWLRPVQMELEALAESTGDPDGSLQAALLAVSQVQVLQDSGRLIDPNNSSRTRRMRGGAAPSEELCFLSREPVVSLLQSALDELIEEKRHDLIITNKPAVGRRRGRAAIPPVTDRRIDVPELRYNPKRRLLGAFQQTDVRWISEVGLARGLSLFRDRHPFNPQPASVVRLSDTARIVMVGDWGSGLPRAQNVAAHMRTHIVDALKDRRQVHALHLGDVYYSGFAREYKNRFLRYWPVEPAEANAVYSWSLNGNHDMYSGGHGYFGTLLADPRFERQQLSSWFSIENDHWRIVGLDTAWDEEGIHDPRESRGLVAPQAETLQRWAAEDDRPFMLLSHHQLFSGWEQPGPHLRNEIQPLLESNRIRAWFWGHEHKCVAYRPFDGVEYGRCVGHGGVPVYAFGDPKQPGPQVDWVESTVLRRFVERWAVFGFAVLDFDGPRVTVSYIDEFGRTVNQEFLTAS